MVERRFLTARQGAEIVDAGLNGRADNVWNENAYRQLVAAVIQSGLQEEGSAYLATADGQAWCLMGGADPELVRLHAQAAYGKHDKNMVGPCAGRNVSARRPRSEEDVLAAT